MTGIDLEGFFKMLKAFLNIFDLLTIVSQLARLVDQV